MERKVCLGKKIFFFPHFFFRFGAQGFFFRFLFFSQNLLTFAPKRGPFRVSFLLFRDLKISLKKRGGIGFLYLNQLAQRGFLGGNPENYFAKGRIGGSQKVFWPNLLFVSSLLTIFGGIIFD